MTSKLAPQWLPCQAPGVIGSVLGLVGPVSVYCDWARRKAGSATSISVWQRVKLSEQIRPWDTLACGWDVKQPTNKQTPPSVSADASGITRDGETTRPKGNSLYVTWWEMYGDMVESTDAVQLVLLLSEGEVMIVRPMWLAE